MTWIAKLSLTVLIALLVHRETQCEAARILGLFPLQGKSHFVMCESLMRGLAARGHQVDVISHFPLKKPPPNYRDISIAGSVPMVMNNLTLSEAETFARTGSIKNLISMAGSKLCDLMKLPQIKTIIDNPPKDPPYDLVIYELFVAECYLGFARHLKVPMVGVVTSKLFDWMNTPMGNPASMSFVPSIFSGFGQRMSFRERLANTFLSSAIRLQHAYYIQSQLSYVEKYLDIGSPSLQDLYKDISILLMNTHPSFDFVRPLTPKIIEVGGLHVTDGDLDMTPQVKKWLDDSKAGCIYFSFGSMVKIESFPEKTLKAFYTSFERIAPIRVLMKIAKPDELPPGLPKNVMLSPWLPQTRVLQHKNVKAFVSHGGLMSTQEAITYGVPLVSIPIFGDQILNARLCERQKVATVVDYKTITADSFTKSIKTILEEPSYRENSKRLAKLFTDRPMSQMDTAIYWVEYVLRNGNVLSSPAEELYWWQVELLDVYAFVIAVLLLGLYVAKKILGLVFRCLFSKKASKQSQEAKLKKNK